MTVTLKTLCKIRRIGYLIVRQKQQHYLQLFWHTDINENCSNEVIKVSYPAPLHMRVKQLTL